jgi:alpha-amylase
MISLLIVVFFSIAFFKTKEEWANRIIYQILTDRFATTNDIPKCTNMKRYCGGTYTGILQKLDYVQGMGFNAIWISPIVENTDNGYHGYWAKDITKINAHFGTESELINLVKECHKRGIPVRRYMGNGGYCTQSLGRRLY